VQFAAYNPPSGGKRGGRQQIGDLLIGVDVGCESSTRRTEQTSGRNLGRWIKLLAVARETAQYLNAASRRQA